jgi:hypothetical protein
MKIQTYFSRLAWTALVAAVEPHYPKCEGRGRSPIGVERMLRIYTDSDQLQH